jgi:hypothetical protein
VIRIAAQPKDVEVVNTVEVRGETLVVKSTRGTDPPCSGPP